MMPNVFCVRNDPERSDLVTWSNTHWPFELRATRTTLKCEVSTARRALWNSLQCMRCLQNALRGRFSFHRSGSPVSFAPQKTVWIKSKHQRVLQKSHSPALVPVGNADANEKNPAGAVANSGAPAGEITGPTAVDSYPESSETFLRELAG